MEHDKHSDEQIKTILEMKNGSVHIPLLMNVLYAPTRSNNDTSPPAPKHTAGTGSNLLCIPSFLA